MSTSETGGGENYDASTSEASTSTKKKKGVAREYLDNNFKEIPTSSTLKNGQIYILYLDNKKSIAKTINLLREKYGNKTIEEYATKKIIMAVVSKYNKFKKHTDVNEFNKFVSLSSETFNIKSTCSDHVNPPAEPVLATPKPPSPVLVKACSKCASLRKRLAKAIASKKVIVDQSKRRINLERYKLKIKKSSHVLQQTVKRKNEQLFRNKQKYCETVAYSQLTEAKKDNRCLKRKNLKLESDLEEQPEVKRLKLQIDAQNNKIENLESQLDMSQKEVSDEFSRDSKNMKVPISTRLFIYECLINQVPTASVRHLFRQSAAIFGVHLNDSDLPHQTTVAQMCRELGVITDIQAVTQILKEKDLTLGFDATTQEGIHVNAIHLTFAKDRCQVVAVIQLAGGTAADYCSHIIKSFDRLAQNYSAYNKINLYDCKKDIISRISNSMTDRVATNHATIVLVNRAWDKSLNELNCHLHPLDTIASSVRETLKKNETDKGKLFGTDCFSGNVVLQMNKLRYMDAKGDPAGFKTMLIKNNLPLGYIPRYRGNRLHVYFNICGKLTCEYSSFEEFLSSGTECGGLRTALLADFRSITTITQMQVVGYIGKLLTGPWMMKFYTSFANEISHLAGIKVVKDVISAIKKKRLDTQSSILNCTTDFFGDLLKRSSVDQPSTSKECELSRKDEVLSALQKAPKDSVLFHQLMDACLDKIVEVLERQYSRYFSLDVTPELILQTESARSHNIDAEELMGMFSAAKKKAPNATMAFLSSKLRSQKNCVGTFLNTLEASERSSLIQFAISNARKSNIQSRRNAKSIVEDIALRRSRKTQKRLMSNRKKLEKKVRDTPLEDFGTEFGDLDAHQLSDLISVFSEDCVGKDLTHIWHDADNNSKVKYYGKMEKIKKRKRQGVEIGIYVVCYWAEGENYDDDDGTDYDLTKYELAVDLILGDLVLL